MTNSNIFKAAHKLAKAYKMQMSGDYAVYFQLALKNLNAAKKAGFKKDDLFKAMNAKIKAVSTDLALITHEVKRGLTHGLKTFNNQHKLNAAKNDLKNGQFFGKSFVKNGMINVWVRSVSFVQEAY